jgi:hypothetical protein
MILGAATEWSIEEDITIRALALEAATRMCATRFNLKSDDILMIAYKFELYLKGEEK